MPAIIATILIILAIVASFCLTVRVGMTYKVDYCGSKDFYKGAKASYGAGKKVTLYYTLIATDTDYSFYLDGEPIHYKYDDQKGFVINFIMPDHNVKLECRAINSMAYIPLHCEEEADVMMVSKLCEHKMKLDPIPFEMIKSGEKTIELRLYDEKRRLVKAGDKIVFTNTATGEVLQTDVVQLHVFDTFKELYAALPLEKCGYTSDDIAKADASDMARYYSLQKQKQYGVVGIEISLCKTDEG